MTGLGHAARRGSLVLCLAVSLVSWSELAHADDEAVTRFERGVQLYEGENYEGALVEFTTAYTLSKNYRLLYNIGICQTALKEYVVATETFQRYLAEGGAEVPETKKADVNDRLAKLALNVAHVRIVTDAPAGTPLLVDDQPVGTVPLPESIAVKIGRRQFSITVDGRRASQTVAVASGTESTTIQLNVAEAAPPVVNVGTQQPTAAGPSFPYVWWGLTAGLGAAAAVTGSVAVSRRNKFEQQQATFGIEQKSLDDARSSARTMGIVTDALLVATVAGAGISTWFTIDYMKKKKKQRTAGLYVTPFGVGYEGGF